MSTLMFQFQAVRDNLVEADQIVNVAVSVNVQLEEAIQSTSVIGEVSVSNCT